MKNKNSLFEQLHKNDSPKDYQCAVIASKIFDKHARSWWEKNAPLVSESEFIEIRNLVN